MAGDANIAAFAKVLDLGCLGDNRDELANLCDATAAMGAASAAVAVAAANIPAEAGNGE
jgi:hypothetical protein